MRTSTGPVRRVSARWAGRCAGRWVSMARYALAGHVFVCVSDEHLVLLDLKEDRYWALDAAQTAGLAPLVPGWPVKGPEENPAELSAETAGAVEVLQARGIL